jgi:hypothetical protein
MEAGWMLENGAESRLGGSFTELRTGLKGRIRRVSGWRACHRV